MTPALPATDFKTVLIIPKGKADPLTHVPARSRTVIGISYDDLPDGAKRVRCDGCQPPTGFRVGPEQWATLYLPYIRRGEING